MPIQVFLIVHCSANLVGADFGYGRPQASLSPHDFYRAPDVLPRPDVLQIHHQPHETQHPLPLPPHLLPPLVPHHRYACIAIVSGYAISSVFATIFQCMPVTRVFNKKIPDHCINITAFWYSNAIYNILTDIVILASIPGVVWSLSLSTRHCIGLTLVFGLDIFVFVTSVLRTTTLDSASKASDITHGMLKSTMWTTIEASTAVICVCLPMMRTPIQKLFPKIFPTKYGTGSAPSAPDASMGGSKSYEALRSPTMAADH